jgi:hypothetical protein
MGSKSPIQIQIQYFNESKLFIYYAMITYVTYMHVI